MYLLIEVTLRAALEMKFMCSCPFIANRCRVGVTVELEPVNVVYRLQRKRIMCRTSCEPNESLC